MPLLLLWLAALPILWLSLTAAPALRVEVGAWGDHAYLSGVYAIEQSSTEAYRWTGPRAELRLPHLSPRYRLLVLRAHGWRPPGVPPPSVALEAGGRIAARFRATPQVRIYRVLLPPAGGLDRVVGITADPYAAPGDGRRVGLAVDWLALRAAGDGGPGLWQFTGQALLLALGALLVLALGLTPGWSAATAAAVVGGLLWANLRQPLWVGQALGAWLLLAIGTLALALWAGPAFRARVADTGRWMTAGQARAAWAILIAALALRLAGAVHPLFNAHDVDVHMRWIDTVASGQWYLYSTPSEAQGRQVFNPPAGYALLLPLALALPSTRLAVQVGVALCDALGCLLLLLVARELRLPGRAAVLALGLAAALPLSMTILWWGFATNIIAQALWLLLLWLLLRLLNRPDRRLAAVAAVVAAAALLTHIGALPLTAVALAFLLLLAPLAGARQEGWRAALASVGLALLFAVPGYFLAVAGPALAAAAPPGAVHGGVLALARVPERLGFSARALWQAYPPWLIVPALGGAALLAARPPSQMARAVLAAWLGAALLLFAIHLTTGMLTRYVYFLAPLVCLCAGAALAALRRGRGGRLAVLALALLTAWPGVFLWLVGTLERVKPSALPLSH